MTKKDPGFEPIQAFAGDEFDQVRAERVRKAIARHEDAPEAGQGIEGEDQNTNTHEGEPIMNTVAATIDADTEAWAHATRQHIEAAVATEDARAALAAAGIDDADQVAPFDLYAYLEIHAPALDLRMPQPPHVPAWVIDSDVWLSTAGEAVILHRGQQHGAHDFAVHIEMSIAVQLYPELSNDPGDRVGTFVVDGPSLAWDATATQDGRAGADDAIRFAAAVTAAAAELVHVRATALEG